MRVNTLKKQSGTYYFTFTLVLVILSFYVLFQIHNIPEQIVKEQQKETLRIKNEIQKNYITSRNYNNIHTFFESIKKLQYKSNYIIDTTSNNNEFKFFYLTIKNVDCKRMKLFFLNEQFINQWQYIAIGTNIMKNNSYRNINFKEIENLCSLNSTISFGSE